MDLKRILTGVGETLTKNAMQCYSISVITIKLLFRRFFIAGIQLFYNFFLVPKVDEVLQSLYLLSIGTLILSTENELGKKGFFEPRVYSLPELQYIYANHFDPNFPREVFYVSNISGIGSYSSRGEYSGHLGQYPKYNITVSGRNESGLFFTKFESETDSDEEYYDRAYGKEFDGEIFRVLGGVHFEKYNDEEIRYTLQFEGEMKRKDSTETFRTLVNKLKNNYTTASMFCEKVGQITGLFDCEPLLMNYFINLVDSTYIRERTGRVVISKVGHVPYHSDGYSLENNIADYQLANFCAMILLFVMPYVIYSITLDKESQTRELMNLQGMKNVNYIISTFIVLVVFFVLYIALFIFFSVIVVEARIFKQVDFLLLLIVFVGLAVSTVSFSFLFSAFFKSAFVSMLIGFFYVFIFPQTFNNVLVNTQESDARKLLLFIFPFPQCYTFTKLFTPILQDNAYMAFNTLYLNIDLMVSIIAMYLSTFVHMVLFVYFEAILPQPFGVRKHPLYFLKNLLGIKETGRKKVTTSADFTRMDSDVRDEMMEMQNEYNSKAGLGKYGVYVMGLKRDFGNKSAVDEIFFRVSKGECFGLLGQNGAGKSTTIKLLTGTISSTSGRAYVCGHEISTGMSEIRKKIGICPQFSIIWPELTIREHLSFYCSIRGIPFTKQKEHIDKILEEVELEGELHPLEKNKLTSFFFKKKLGTFSEGIQRRLAIAISLIGDPDVIFLDEPTTGLDPESKKCIWQIILRLKKTRCIVLTTHSMTEADILSDRIGIMAYGKFLCMGSNLHLKEKFGKGYILKVRYENVEDRNKLLEMIHAVVPVHGELRMVRDFSNAITWEIKAEKMKISPIFKAFEKNRKRLGIQEWSINQVSLEEVFLSLVKEDFLVMEEVLKENKRLLEENRRLKGSSSENGEELGEDSNVFITDPLEENLSVSTGREDSVLLEDGDPKLERNFLLVFVNQVVAMIRKEVIYVIRHPVLVITLLAASAIFTSMVLFVWNICQIADTPITNPEIENNFVKEFSKCITWTDEKDCYQFVYTVNGNGFASLLMNNIIEKLELDEDGFKEFEDTSQMTTWMGENVNQTKFGVSFSSTESMYYGFVNYTEYTFYINTTSATFPKGDLVSQFESMQLMIDREILEIETNKKSTIKRIQTRNIPLVPLKENPSKFDFLFKSSHILYTMVAFPAFLYVMIYLVSEREKKVILFILTNGMKKLPLIIGYALHFIVTMAVVVVVCYATSFVCGIPMFLEYQGILPFVTLMFYTFSLFSQVLLFGRFAKTTRQVMSMIILFAVSSFFTSSVFESDLVQAIYSYSYKDDRFLWGMFYVVLPVIFPPLPFGKVYSDFMLRILDEYDYEQRKFEPMDGGFKFMNLFDKQPDHVFEFESPPTFLFYFYFLASIVLYMLLYVLFEYIEKRRYFSSESEKAETSGGPDNVGIQLKGVGKKYGFFKKEMVLENVNINVPKNGVYVLLGPEASGKTTMLEIINGMHRITRGLIKINGVSVKDNLSETTKQVGFLPQLNILIEHMTCREILSLFARIRGLKRGIVDQEINRILKELNLLQNKNDKIGTFSGGMKRRIAFGIVMIGNPDVWLLDESTTGLDPLSKNLVWNTIIDNKEFKTIFLTTHEMDEAEVLSDRIGILVDGNVKREGSTLDLKRAHGESGYNLSLIAVKGRELELHDFLSTSVSCGKLVSCHNNFFCVNISNQNIAELIRVLKAVESLEDSFLENWGISQTDLYDVYRAVVFGKELQSEIGSDIDIEMDDVSVFSRTMSGNFVDTAKRLEERKKTRQKRKTIMQSNSSSEYTSNSNGESDETEEEGKEEEDTESSESEEEEDDDENSSVESSSESEEHVKAKKSKKKKRIVEVSESEEEGEISPRKKKMLFVKNNNNSSKANGNGNGRLKKKRGRKKSSGKR